MVNICVECEYYTEHWCEFPGDTTYVAQEKRTQLYYEKNYGECPDFKLKEY